MKSVTEGGSVYQRLGITAECPTGTGWQKVIGVSENIFMNSMYLYYFCCLYWCCLAQDRVLTDQPWPMLWHCKSRTTL